MSSNTTAMTDNLEANLARARRLVAEVVGIDSDIAKRIQWACQTAGAF